MKHSLISFFKYPGSKDRVSRQMIKWGLLNVAHTHYLEPFCGSAETLLHKDKSANETINDINPYVTNLYIAARDNGPELHSLINQLPYCYESWDFARRNYDNANLTSVSRAAAYFVARNQGHTARPLAAHGHTTSGRLHTYLTQVAQLPLVTARMQEVKVLNGIALDAITANDTPDTFIYLDPPYPQTTRQRPSDKKGVYEFEMMQPAQHIPLLKAINDMKSMIVISSYDSALYNRYLPHWRKYTYPTFCALRSIPKWQKGAKRNRVNELVWINPQMQIALMAQRSFR
jgi:DNA adenine methylase